jgi:hypothetical protein
MSADVTLLDRLRIAMRAIGPHYHLVESAARRAARAGRAEAADRLDYVYGRLVWIDHVLGTQAERCDRDPMFGHVSRDDAAEGALVAREHEHAARMQTGDPKDDALWRRRQVETMGAEIARMRRELAEAQMAALKAQEVALDRGERLIALGAVGL